MKYFSEKNLGKISFVSFVVLAVTLICALGGWNIYTSYKELDEDIRFMEKTFLENQKEQLRLTVTEQILRMEIRRDLVMEELKSVLQTKTRNITGVIESLNEKYKESMSSEEVQLLIRETIRPLSFHGATSYVFIHSMDGIPQLYPPDPSLEGLVPDMDADPNMKKVFAGLTKIITERGEGVYEYWWPKLGCGDPELGRKIAYVQYFKPFNWMIGVGDYFDSFQTKTHQAIFTVLQESTTSSLGSYFFLYQLHNIEGGDNFATMLVNSNRPELVGTKLSDSYTDVKGNPFRKKMLKGLRENGEAYVEYWYKKPGSEKISRKLSYFKLYPEWNWVLARGVYFDDLEDTIAIKRELLAKKVRQDLLLFFWFLLAALVVALAFASFFSKGIKVIFEQYKKKQQSLQVKLEKSRDELELRVQSRTSELEKTHAQLLHSEKLAAIGTFSASIAHEFNNPLAGVVNVFSRLQRTVKLKESDEHLVTMALAECTRMERLIKDLQTFNRPSSGRKSLFELRSIVESILLLSKKELSLRHIRVETDYSPSPTTVLAIEDQIKQVLLNLIKNGMEAIPDTGGVLRISTERTERVVTVTVQDNGSGIRGEYLKQVFDPFFTTKTSVKGTGLGLSVSYNIIKSHGGDLSVTSELGKGATFFLSLPAATEA